MDYNKQHLAFLIDEFVKAYYKQEFDECKKLKEQISNLKELLNSKDRIISESQKLEIY
jgi:cell division septum initiation protein DivIVA